MSTTVLIVDDSLTIRMDLADAFEQAGFEAILCASAGEARRTLAAATPSLVVLDVVLPDGDGIALLRELRNNPATFATPVLLLSTEAEIGDRIRGMTHGANGYVGKPYDAADVVARAHALLRHTTDATDVSLNVLIIDDSITYRTTLAEVLEGAGHRTTLCASGADGLRQAAALRPDAIIVDGVMPEMDGTTVIRTIRLDPALNTTPCLLLTASEGDATEVIALDGGADAYARKSEGADVVLARLNAMLRAASHSRHAASSATTPHKKRILAVDDSVTYLEELAHELSIEGYEVVKAKSGEDALDLLALDQVDCILLDLVMPGLSGTDTCKRIKQAPVLRNIPLIMLTARDEPGALIEGINAGADDYVVKTVDFSVIKARLRAQLRRKQIEDENRRVREEILSIEAEGLRARETAKARAVLLEQLEVKNRDLEILNRDLQMFAYSVSHDLRQPLRSMDGFSKALLDDYGAQFDDKGRHYLARVRAGAKRMDQLIGGLLVLSRVTRQPLEMTPLRLDLLAHNVINRLREAEPERELQIVIATGLDAYGDAQLVESVFENLLGNAWKFTAGRADVRIEVGVETRDRQRAFFVRDNGGGFSMDYADKLFAPFQRLHADRDFPGTGIGLAIARRIIHRHGGRIWAESAVDRGATFYFTLAPGSGE